ncbi:MAG: hypothetical protein ACKV2T_30350 [Kofleriaceae bacterium]
MSDSQDLFVALLAGGAMGYVVRAVQATLHRKAKQLPKGAGQPRNRAEAVRRVLKHLERKKIAELVEGSAAVIEGTVRPLADVPPLTAPHTGSGCVGYHLDIRAGWVDHDASFPQLHDEARCNDFELVDASGVIRVIGAGLELAITDGPVTFHGQGSVRFLGNVPPHITTRVPHHDGAITVEEGLLMPGARILVCGVVSREAGATGYRDGTQVFTMRATPSFPLVASTDADLFVAGDRPIAPEELHRRRS